MTSKTDIILARQRSTLMHSIGELHRLLDEDDNWRALAALESVGEAAGGVVGYAWIARQEELIASLAENPAYCLCKELERALAVVSQHIGKPRAVASAPVSQPDTEAVSFEQSRRFTPVADLPQAFESYEPRSSTIAERIATLAVPLITPAPIAAVETVLNSNLHIDASGSADSCQDQEPVPILDAQPDVVAEAAKTIVASLLVASAVSEEHSDAPKGDVEERQGVRDSLESAELQEVQEVDPPDLSDAVEVALNPASEDFSVSATDQEVLSTDEDTNRVASETEDVLNQDDKSAPVAEISEVDFDGSLAIDAGHDQDSLAGSQDAAVEILDDYEDDLAGLSDHIIDDEDFEAEVSIVSRTTPISQPTPQVYLSADGKTDADREPEDSLTEVHETLEQRLQRLDRQSQTLIEPKSSDPAKASEADEPSRANKWLEMIRARRTKLAAEPHIGLPLSQPEIVSHQNDFKDVSVETPNYQPPLNDDSDADEKFDLEGDIEAEVKIVHRRAGDTAEPRSRSQSLASAPPSTDRPYKIAREQAAVPATPFGGDFEEASVEIIRHGGGAKSATLAPASSRAANNRFIKTLTGE